MKVVVIGANGQLGSDVVKVFNNAIPLTHKDIEITDLESCRILEDINPDVVINTAAFHRTDDCEIYPEEAFKVNAIGAKNIAEITKKIGAINVFISTDYVFDGKKSAPYTEYDTPNPVNTYGISKLAGELFTRNYSEKYYIFRVASLFGVAGASGKGGNFIETMIKKAKNNEDIKVVDDIIMSPTYTADAAQVIKKVITKNAPFGVYHTTNTGFCSWFSFAKAIFELLDLHDVKLQPIKASEYKTRAKRPMFSALSSKKLKSVEISIPEWKDALKRYLEEKGHILKK